LRVYAFLSRRVWQGATTKVGVRLIASSLHTSRSVVSEAIARLAKNGHITITASGRQRPLYTLTSPVFSQKQGQENVIVSSPSRGRRLASVERKSA
jgi:DNA-binding transcriptional regulator LsrR (DeoR family)